MGFYFKVRTIYYIANEDSMKCYFVMNMKVPNAREKGLFEPEQLFHFDITHMNSQGFIYYDYYGSGWTNERLYIPPKPWTEDDELLLCD